MLTDLLLIAAGGEIDLVYSKPQRKLRARYEHEHPTAIASMLKHSFPTGVSREGHKLRFIGSREYEREDHPLPPLTPDEVAGFCATANEKAILVTCELPLALEYGKSIAWKNLDKVIMLTGAHTSPAMVDSDADINIGFALAAAQLYTTPGVYIAFRGEIHIWNQCKRTDTGFTSWPTLAPVSAFV